MTGMDRSLVRVGSRESERRETRECKCSWLIQEFSCIRKEKIDMETRGESRVKKVFVCFEMKSLPLNYTLKILVKVAKI